jgi:CRP-like cAMP-binding protein
MSSSQNELSSFLKDYPVETYPKNSVVLAAGDDSDFFYYLESGAIKMVTVSEKGRALILHMFFPNSFFSLLTLVSQNINEYDFIALVPSTIRKIPKFELINFLKQHSDVLFDLQLRLLKGLDGLLERIERSSLTSAYHQVANLLIYFSRHFSEPTVSSDQLSKKLKIKITHQEISEWLGLSRENVSIQMKLLENNGYIQTNAHFIEIPNVTALAEL